MADQLLVEKKKGLDEKYAAEDEIVSYKSY